MCKPSLGIDLLRLAEPLTKIGFIFSVKKNALYASNSDFVPRDCARSLCRRLLWHVNASRDNEMLSVHALLVVGR